MALPAFRVPGLSFNSMALLAIFRDADWLNAERIRRIAVIFLILSLLTLAGDVWVHTRAGLGNALGDPLGRDYLNYWAAAHLAADGRASEVYDIVGFMQYQRAHAVHNAMIRWFAYPPVAILYSLPLAPLSYVTGWALTTIAGPLLCMVMLARYLRWRMTALAAFATPATLLNAMSGQNGQLTAAFFGGGFMLLERGRPWAAGLAFGLLCYKPHLAILLPFAFGAGGYWRTFLSTGLMALAVMGLTAFLFGPHIWVDFAHNAGLNQKVLETITESYHRMPTVFAMVALLGGGIRAAYVLSAVSAIAAIVVTIRIWRSDAPLQLKAAGLIFAAFPATLYAWDYDLVVLTFAVVWYVQVAAADGFRPWEKITLALAMIVPIVGSSLASYAGLSLEPVILWAMVLLTARRALQPSPQAIGHAQPA